MDESRNDSDILEIAAGIRAASTAHNDLNCNALSKRNLAEMIRGLMGKEYSFAILAPADQSLEVGFGHELTNSIAHANLLGSIQSLRGDIYLRDGAICISDLDQLGRFTMKGDENGWHLILLDNLGRTAGCVRYLMHSPRKMYSDLAIAQSAIARHTDWAYKVRRAVTADLDLARKERLRFVEVGGWALRDDFRNTRAAHDLMIASYALGSLWGGSIGCCTATARHSSSSMLRRLGGMSFVFDGDPIPAYYDPVYGCQMELLRFDYRSPAPRFARAIPPLVESLSRSPIFIPQANHASSHTDILWAHDLLQLHLATGVTSLSEAMACVCL